MVSETILLVYDEPAILQLARIQAILRRAGSKPRLDAMPIQVADLKIDPSRHEVHVGARVLELRAQEFDLLRVLAEQPGRVFTREQLLQLAWGFDFYGQTRTVDVHVAPLRRRLEGAEVRIKTVTGVGYKLSG